MTEPEKKPRRRPPPPEPKPIIGGRLWIPIGMVIVMAIIANPRFNGFISQRYAPKVKTSNPSQWKPGGTTELKVTLITADYQRLACSSDEEFDGTHCEFRSEKDRWPRNPAAPLDDNKVSVVQPYRTSPGNHLILLSGLWAMPEVAMRLHQEPARGVPEKRLNRFEATCNVRFVKKVDKVKLRWETRQKWLDEQNAMVARPLTCTVGG